MRRFFSFKTQYQGIGIDRVAACYGIPDGVVVDAGSAITVDLMEGGVHKGGFIMPGIRAYNESFARLSPVLKYDLHEEIDLETCLKIPKMRSVLHFLSRACS